MRKGIGHEIGKRRVPDHTKTAPRGVKTPQDAPRPRSWSQLGPKRGPKIDPKSIKIRAWEPPRPKTPPGVPSGRKMTPKSKKKRLILTPKICKKRPASRFVFQRFWVGKSEAQYQKRASIPGWPADEPLHQPSNKSARTPTSQALFWERFHNNRIFLLPLLTKSLQSQISSH